MVLNSEGLDPLKRDDPGWDRDPSYGSCDGQSTGGSRFATDERQMVRSGTTLSCVPGCQPKYDVSHDQRFDRCDKTLCDTATKPLEVSINHTEKWKRESGRENPLCGGETVMEAVSYSSSNQEIGTAAGRRTSQRSSRVLASDRMCCVWKVCRREFLRNFG